MPADVLVQLGRGGVGFYAEFVRKSLPAHAVLHQGQMWQALPAVTTHQPAMRVLPAGISFDDAQAQAGADRVVASVEVQLAQTAQGVEMSQPQAFAGQRGPVLIRVVCHEISAVEARRELVVTRRFVEVLCFVTQAAGLHVSVELLDVQPQAEIVVDPVGATPMYDYRLCR